MVILLKEGVKEEFFLEIEYLHLSSIITNYCH